MKYRKDRYGNDLSVLGYGCMRFTQKAGRTDVDKAEKEVMRAIEGGVNYFDTAYVYGGSEVTLGEILARNNVREKVYIATKLPHYLMRSVQGVEKIFGEQLTRLKTDYIDYYLMHMLTNVKTWNRLVELGIDKWLEEKKASGAIKQVGFSYHGNTDGFKELLDAYDWDFCQIQYNYMDENSQAGREGLLYAAAKGIPVVIMEPLRGGRLANNIPKEGTDMLEQIELGGRVRTPAEWALRWLWQQEEVSVVLSGMNSIEMIDENMRVADECEIGEFGEKENEVIENIKNIINSKMKVGCTGCRYCMPCPKNVDIPGTFAAYNRIYSDGKFIAFKEYFMCTALRRDNSGAGNCIECGKCEKHCPQDIEIRKMLKESKKALEGPIYKLGKGIMKVIKF